MTEAAPSDEQLLAAARTGDRQSLETLLERHQGEVYRFGMKMCRDPDDAKDVLQDTLLAMARGDWSEAEDLEECFQQAKNEAGLDQYQVRAWRAWYAHITLSMLALAWLAASRAQAEKGASAPATQA